MPYWHTLQLSIKTTAFLLSEAFFTFHILFYFSSNMLAYYFWWALRVFHSTQPNIDFITRSIDEVTE